MADAYSRTPRLGIPLMADTGQRNAHIIYNEMLGIADAMMHPNIIGVSNNETSWSDGEMWIVGSAPTGNFADFTEDNIVFSFNLSLVEVTVLEGFWGWVTSNSGPMHYTGSAWTTGPS